MRNTALDVKQFGQRLRAIRLDQMLTQAMVAALMGASQGWLSDLESGKQAHVQADTVVRLCSVLHISADYLLGLGESLPGHLVYKKR